MFPVAGSPCFNTTYHQDVLFCVCQARQQAELRTDMLAGDLCFPAGVPQLNTRRTWGSRGEKGAVINPSQAYN